MHYTNPLPPICVPNTPAKVVSIHVMHRSILYTVEASGKRFTACIGSGEQHPGVLVGDEVFVSPAPWCRSMQSNQVIISRYTGKD